MNLNQALKYSTKEDVIDSAVRSARYPALIPSHHLQIAADAFEDQGQEGHADLLREFGKGYLGQEPAHTALGPTGPLRTNEAGRSPLNAYLHLIGPAEEETHRIGGPDRPSRPRMGKPTGLALVAHLNARGQEQAYGPSHRMVRLLSPTEAKAATARFPNAAEIHQFIDHHFNAPPEAQ
jgi:hypothetical protein